MNHKLMDEITKILILSRYEIENPCGCTAQEIQSFEKRAIDTYLGKSDDPHKIVFNTFHAKIERDVALILGAIKRHPNQAMHSDGEGCIHCDSDEDIPSAFNYCPYCNKKLRRR